MMPKPQQNRASLLATARAVAARLKQQSEGTRLRIRIPSRTTTTNTDGWCARIGDLGAKQPRLEIWLDRFSGYSERKLYACFQSELRAPLLSITKRVRRLWPARVVTLKDTDEEKFLVLAERLGRSEFNVPILEKYSGGSTFYGIFDPTRASAGRASPHFRNRAVAFFEDVARALPSATSEDEQREVYPQFENRKRVASHLKRERSRLLATECKIRDNYACQVCGMRFEAIYGGKLGKGYAEAHHLIPLGQLRGNVRTRLDDLRTVCANCHRMLHRMKGKRSDIRTLQAIVRRMR